MNPIVKILVERDNISIEEAENIFDYAQDRVLLGDDPEEVLEEEFGLEPDYIFDLINGL